ncbi:restriction endonuclease [Paenirhodobacter hankyongi]|nr:restriction endonuclease [Sinirhodobacter hankyongi]
MYYSALRKLIASVEETKFYDVAILFLEALRYRELTIVDGTGDGGRDVNCSRADLRIQLSVRKDWSKKINEEAAATKAKGLRHLIYVTNRHISPAAEAEFRAKRFLHAGEVEVSIHDLNRISTTLTRPGRIRRAYEMMGASLATKVVASRSEIALSSVLLFGEEAKEMRDGIIDANVLACLYRKAGTPDDELVAEVTALLPGANPTKSVLASISRLRASGRIMGPKDRPALSESEAERMKGSEEEFLFAFQADVDSIMAATGLHEADARHILHLSTEILLKGNDFYAGDMEAEGVRAFLAERGLTANSKKIYESLAKCTIASHFQYAKTVNQIFSANTFDIYRALGAQSDIQVVLDTSVALPLLFGLEYQGVRSRYSVAAAMLLEVCRVHEFSIMVPKPYVNEMAAHGLKALEFLDTYGALPEDVRPVLRGSGNAYLSHFSHLQYSAETGGVDLTLSEFLQSFGLRGGASLLKIENKIISMLESHGISTGMDSRYDKVIRDEIAEKKSKYESKHVLDHDAAVCTALINDAGRGYIFATWDKVLIDAVQNLARVYADSPARVTDFLGVIEGVDNEFDNNVELLTTLVHLEERQAERLSKIIEKIRSPDQASKLGLFIDKARSLQGSTWMPDIDDLTHFLDTTSPDETSKEMGSTNDHFDS